jgi:hypothetical protein
MSVLLFLTLLYVAILVLALTVGLIAIAYFLHGTRANLARIAGELQQVDKHVEPLTNAFTAVNDGLATLLARVHQVHNHLASADAALEAERRAS